MAKNFLLLGEAQDNQELPISDRERDRLKEKFFLDTLFITTEDDSESSLHTILVRSLELFRYAFRSSIPLRGGVVHGTWFEKQHSKKIYLQEMH